MCVDVIDCGEKAESFQGAPEKLVHKIAIVYQSTEINPDTGKRFELSVEKTLAFGQTAGLRKFLGLWRGKAYSDEEARVGAPLHKLVTHNAMLAIEHKLSAKGRTYANVLNISPYPKGAAKMEPLNYERAEYWQQRKADYAASAQAYRAKHGQASNGAAQTVPAEDDDSDMPF